MARKKRQAARTNAADAWTALAFLPADLQDLYPVRINFARRLELIGLQFEQEYDRLILRLCWKLLCAVSQRADCFAHVLNVTGTRIDLFDHALLGGSPALPDWEPGDQAWERVSLQLPDAAARNLWLRLGLYDPTGNVRWPIWSSTVSVVDNCTAAVIELGQAPSTEQLYEFPDAAPETCRVIFEEGVELSYFSISKVGPWAWLRLGWVFSRPLNRRWRFFGHGVGGSSRDSPILVSFDQDLAPHWKAPMVTWEQNIVRDITTAHVEPLKIAAGIFDPKSGRRLNVLESSLPLDRQLRRIFLDLGQACSSGGGASGQTHA